MTWPCFKQNGHHLLRETSTLPSFTQCDDVSLCLGRIIGSNSVDFRVECFFMTPFGCRVMRTSRTETQKKVTNHRGQSQNKQSGWERTCPTCVLHIVEVNVCDKHACALSSVAPNTIAKPVTQTPRGREYRHVNGYTLGCLRGQAKCPTGAPIRLPLEFRSFAKRLLYEKPLVLNQAIAALRRSIGLPGRFVTAVVDENSENLCLQLLHSTVYEDLVILVPPFPDLLL